MYVSLIPDPDSLCMPMFYFPYFDDTFHYSFPGFSKGGR